MSEKALTLLELYRLHMKACRNEFGGVRQKRLFQMIEDFEWCFPDIAKEVGDLFPGTPEN